MLTPKKVFVDTIVTQLSLLSSGVLTEAEESQDGPPRAKRIVVPGEHHEKNLHVLHFPSKDAYSTRWRTRFHADGGQCSSVMADSVPR